MRSLRLTAVVSGLLAVLALSACAGASDVRVTRLPSDGLVATGSASPPASPTTAAPRPNGGSPDPTAPIDAADCAGGSIVLTAQSPSLTVIGDCPDVRVQGSDLVVDLSGASVDTLEVSGDRLTIDIASAGRVTVQGNDNVLVGGAVSALTIRGDRTDVTTSSPIGSVVVQGNDNTVRAQGGAAQVSDDGARNALG